MSDITPLTNNSDNSNTFISPTNNQRLNSPTTDYKLDKLEPIKKQLEEVKQLTVNNIEKVLERGDQIEVLVDNSEKLQQNSVSFYKSAKRIKNKMCYNKIKWYLFILSVFSLFIYVIAALICGNGTLKHCK